ncbi:MAG: hypothetical protein IJC86_02395 [Clostridia bacterium]|nr:hypothetical protein [Clostridia bacterium]
MTKRLLASFLSVLMLMSLVCVGSVSAAESYYVYVSETEVTSLNASDVLGDGTVSFDPATYTLTLNNANIVATDNEGWGWSSGIVSSYEDLTINLIGKNTITAKAGTDGNTGIDVFGGNLTINEGKSGSSLTVNSTNGNAISVSDYYDSSAFGEKGVFTINSGKITATTSDNEYSSTAVYVYGKLDVKGGSLYAQCGESESNTAIDVYSVYEYIEETDSEELLMPGTITIAKGATVTAICGDVTDFSYGVYAEDNIKVEGTLTATSGDSSGDSEYGPGYSYGIYTAGIMMNFGGNITATAGDAEYTYGINARNSFTMTDGTLTAKAGDGVYSYGMYSRISSSFEGGKATLSGGTAEYSSVGLWVASDWYYDEETDEEYPIGGDLYVFSGADITATAGTANGYSDGIITGGNVEIYGGNVTAKAGKIADSGLPDSADSTAIWSDCEIYIYGGTVSLYAEPVYFNGEKHTYGVSSMYGTYIEDGLTITGAAEKYYDGIESLTPAKDGEPIIITDGEGNTKYALGDVNLDGTVNVRDATAIQKHLADIITLTADGLAVADYDEDGKLTVKDATAIQKMLAGIV